MIRRGTLVCLILVAVAVALSQWFTPYYGDDLNYMEGMYMYGHGANLTGTAYEHWLRFNGRISNLVLAVMLRNLPHWLVAALNGVATASLMGMVIRLTELRNELSQSLMIAALAVMLPWWDNFAMMAISLNYTWAMLVVLLWLQLLLSTRRLNRWQGLAGILLAGFAGLQHEALSLPLTAGLMVYMATCNTDDGRIDRYKSLMVTTFAMAAVFLCFSPGVVYRLIHSSANPDASPAMLLLTSGYMAIAMWLMILAGLTTRRGRTALKGLCHSPWIVYATAATVGAYILMKGGTIGRAGFFAQAFAIMAITTALKGHVKLPTEGWIARVLTVAICAAVVAHYAASAVWQYRLGREQQQLIEAFQASTDGVVKIRYTHHKQLPWYVAGKPQGVAEPTEKMLNGCISTFYGNGKTITVVEE